jgi:hypothetical protein
MGIALAVTESNRSVSMRLRHLAPVAAAAAALAACGTAHALTVIDFEGGPTGTQAEGFNATGAPELSFFSDLGAGLELATIPEGDGNSLLVRNDTNGNFLKGVFNDGTHDFLSLTFGNDDPGFTNPGDSAVLRVFLGSTFVGATMLVMNRDDLMNQTISFASGTFDNFTFTYTNPLGSVFTGGGAANTGLIEVVDNITFDSVGAAIPEPAAWAMMIMGFGGVGALRRRRRLAIG